MAEAFIYDHVRTPRGRGKADGALHEVTALNLATQALAAIKDRNSLDPALVDDVVLGYMWCRIAAAAHGKLAGDTSGRMSAKLVTARFFVERLLPETAAHLARIKSGAGSLME